MVPWLVSMPPLWVRVAAGGSFSLAVGGLTTSSIAVVNCLLPQG